jgi:two-component system KDP operon response regulator KdpE
VVEPKITILVVDDESPIRRFLKTTLKSQGYKVVEACNGAEGLSLAASHLPDIILLDLGLPDMDGLEVLKKLRERCQAPVVILSARGREADKILGLESGADDYLTKPFGVGELTARIKVALRHTQVQDKREEPLFASGDLKVDLVKRFVSKRGEEIHLTPNEWRLLELLVRHPGKLLTQSQLLKEVWGPAGEDNANYLRTYMHQLRKKIEDDSARPVWLMTEPGVGYRLKADESPSTDHQ